MDSGVIPTSTSIPTSSTRSASLNNPSRVRSEEGQCYHCTDRKDLPPQKRFKTDDCVVPYFIEEGKPQFMLSGQQLAPAAATDLQQSYQPEPALLNAILAEEIIQLTEQLLLLKGLSAEYSPALQTLTLDFSSCSANIEQQLQLPMILGADFLKGRQPSVRAEGSRPADSPDFLRIYLNSGKVSYIPVGQSLQEFSLPTSAVPMAPLANIHRLLLQRALGEVLYQQQQPLLDQRATNVRLTQDDPDYLGFRILLSEQEDGLRLSLADVNAEVAQQVWGCCDGEQLLNQLRPLLTQLGPGLSITSAAPEESGLILPISRQQLATQLQQSTGQDTGSTVVDREDHQEQYLPEGKRALPLDQALQELTPLKDKLAVADVYRTVTQNTGHSTLPTNIRSLYPLHTQQGVQLYCDTTSGHCYCLKFYRNQAAARNEVLMAQLAQASGLLVPETDLLGDRKQWVISRWPYGLRIGKQALQDISKPQLAQLFLTGAWLGNSGIIGYGFNNVGVDDQQHVYGLDWSGAGYYQTNHKRKRVDHNNRGGFLGTVYERQYLRDTDNNLAAAQIFESLTEDDIAAVVPGFLEQASRRVTELLAKYGPSGTGERDYLEKTLYERLNHLAMCYPRYLPATGVTNAELQAIRLYGHHGSELAVRSDHIVNHGVIISTEVDAQGQPCTQLGFQLSRQKTTELANALKQHPSEPTENGTRYQLGSAAAQPGAVLIPAGLPALKRPIQIELKEPDAKCDLESEVRLITPGAPSQQTVEELLGWLQQYGLDIRRPDPETMGRHYRQMLTSKYPMMASFAPWQDAEQQWRDYIGRDNGRMVYCHPDQDGTPSSAGECLCFVYGIGSSSGVDADALARLMDNGLHLDSGRSGRVWTQLQSTEQARGYSHLVFKSALRRRMDIIAGARSDGQQLDDTGDNRVLIGFRELSLLDSLDHIVAKNKADQHELLEVLRQAGFDNWPDGRPVAELVRDVRLSPAQQYRNCLAPDSTIPAPVKQLITAAGPEQFTQLLAVNPELLSGQLVSLEGIRLRNLTFQDIDFTGLNLSGCQLTGTTFINCQVANCHPADFDLRNTHWHFPNRNTRRGNIKWLIDGRRACLDQGFNAQKDAQLVEGLFKLYIATGRAGDSILLLEKYGYSLSINALRACLKRLSVRLGVSRQTIIGTVNRLGGTTEKLHLKLRCAMALGEQVFSQCLQNSDLRRLATLFPEMDTQLQRACWPRLKEEAAKENSTAWLPQLNLTLAPFFQQWLAEQSADMQLLTRLLIGTDRPGRSPLSRNTLLACYEQALILQPGNVQIYTAYIAAVSRYHLSKPQGWQNLRERAVKSMPLCSLGPSNSGSSSEDSGKFYMAATLSGQQLARQICQRGLEQCKDAADREALLKQYLTYFPI